MGSWGFGWGKTLQMKPPNNPEGDSLETWGFLSGDSNRKPAVILNWVALTPQLPLLGGGFTLTTPVGLNHGIALGHFVVSPFFFFFFL